MNRRQGSKNAGFNAVRSGGNAIIKAESLIKTYHVGRREIAVLRGIDVQVAEGEFVAVVGPSGAGKSTLLHLLGTLEQPSSGTVLLDGNDVSALTQQERAKLRRSLVGFIFQFHHLLPAFSALENAMMPGLILGMSRYETEKSARDLLEHLGLGDRLHNKPAELSGGEQQRVAVARALINRPRMILADEPSGNLDRATGSLLEDDLVRFARELRSAVVVVTHNEQWAARADRVLRLVDGRIENGGRKVAGNS